MADAIAMRLRCYVVQETVNNPGPNDPAPEKWPGKYGEAIKLTAVYDSDKASPNWSYSVATPAANLDAYISNPAAWGFFEKDAEYDIIVTKRTPAA